MLSPDDEFGLQAFLIFSAVSSPMSGSSKNFQPSNMANEKVAKRSLVASSSGTIQHKALKHIATPKPLRLRGGHTRQVVLFLLKVAALETVRRLSRARCPFVWRAIQALSILGYPPFKWIQRWSPIRMIVKGMQKLSRPLLFLSIATAFSDQSEVCRKSLDSADDSQRHSDLPTRESTSDTRNCDESPNSIVPENWLLKLLGELEKEGINLPERINEQELRRFYTAANGDFSCLLSSVKKTIRWRETYNILSRKELETWSHLVFWHGLDVMLRPCLVIRLGLACSSLVPHEKPRFAQAVVSQIEYGVLHLMSEDDPRITVLMDCEGLPPFRFPMQILRSCSTLVQDHYPNRLGTLFVIRLPSVVRVIAQTFIQVLKPTTRQKLRVEGENYQKVLSEFLQTVPVFLGGDCTCSSCEMLVNSKKQRRIKEISKNERRGTLSDDESALDAYPITELPLNGNCDHVLRTAILSILMLWIFVAFLAGMYDPESLSSLPI